jgi:hypothetical protein
MDTFEIIVLSIAIILLIGVLAVFTYFMTQVAKTNEWPPMISPCPDSWTTETYFDGDVSRNICVDTNNLIDSKCKSFYAETDNWSAGGTSGTIEQSGNDNTTPNTWLVYQDENEDYQYTGYEGSGTHDIDNSKFSNYYTFDSVDSNDTSQQSNQSIFTNDSNSDYTYSISDDSINRPKISFELSEADSLTKSQKDTAKRKWSHNCGVSWDGISNSG